MARNLTTKPLDLELMVRRGADLWRDYNESLNYMQDLCVSVMDNPKQLGGLAKYTLLFVRDQRRLARRYLRARYGIKVTPVTYVPGETELRFPPARFPKENRMWPTLTDHARMRGALYGYAQFEILWWSMNYATQQAYKALLCDEIVCSYLTKKYALWGFKGRVVKADRRRNYTAEAALWAYFYVMRNIPIAIGTGASYREGPPAERRLEELAAGMVSSWVRAGIKMYPSLREALADAGDPQDVLAQELPGAVLAELAKLEPGAAQPDPGTMARLDERDGHPGVYKLLVNRVSDHLRNSGSAQKAEAQYRARKEGHEITGTRPKSPERKEGEESLRDSRRPLPQADVDIEDFELSETMRQQLDQLKSWAELVKLSEREAQVHELDMQTNLDTAAIAHELGMPPKKVRDYRSRYVAKFRRVAGL